MRLLSTNSTCVFLIVVSTPTKLFQKNNVEQSFENTSKKLKKEKFIHHDQISKNTFYRNQSLIHISKFQLRTKTPYNYDKSLKELFAANDMENGELQCSYDKLYTEKIQLDFQIADHFNQIGEDLLATHYEQLSKHHTREA